MEKTELGTNKYGDQGAKGGNMRAKQFMISFGFPCHCSEKVRYDQSRSKANEASTFESTVG